MAIKENVLSLVSLKEDLETVRAQQDEFHQELVGLEERVYTLEQPVILDDTVFFAEEVEDPEEADPIPPLVHFETGPGNEFGWPEFGLGIMIGELAAIIFKVVFL